ncbi:serine/threonine-protein kinase [Piscinibacter sp.]|uniref:serine/threonine-protein kinase n=1 Tax=Piscinibacter sp. TaxID=1903157 RepID=UPI002BB161D5|nr:serine/threonine-protein kinase [Albitalea sp.]HUG23903.1 serine/threonine-protein kinase [Albitalea sp.]
MNRTPEQQWSALSALYEEADTLPASALAKWLAELEAQGNPLLPQLKRMLEARAQLETDDFLGTLPKLAAEADEQASGWAEGSRVGPYRLVRPLGEGGMAEVWLAERADGAFKRQVAIKLPYPRPGRESFALRFDRERDILATLRHPHIAGLYDAGVTKEGQAWLALEYVEGQAISTYCDERRLSVRERVQLFRQVLLAVQHAHANLVIHRDLKPANILVTPQGEVRLLDFGIAKLLEAQGDAIAETELTRQAGRSMTPRYASPEQLTGLPLTTACDVYSLGVVFYELMCGERPYELKVESAAQLEHAILETEPRAPSRRSLSLAAAEARSTTLKTLARILSPELDAIALRCLGKTPAKRYSSVDVLLADVDRWLTGEPVLARAPGAWYRLRKFAMRHRLAVGFGVTAVVSLAVTAAVAVVLGLQAQEESARAGAARDFMLGLFKQADQEKARGADITARELLEAGRQDVLTRLADQPRLQAELLQGIGSIQKDMGEYVGADSTFADAARLYEQLGMSREASLALTARVDAAIRMGNMKVARAVLQQVKSLPGRPGADAELNAYMAEVEGWIAYAYRETTRARDLFKRSHEQALKAFGPHHVKTLDTLRGRIYAERELRNFDGALRLLEELEAIVATAGAFGASGNAGLARDRADLMLSAGRFAESLDHILTVLPKCITELGPNHAECRALMFRKASAMLRLGMTKHASRELPSLEAIADDGESPALGADTLLLILQIDSSAGSVNRRIASFERVKALVESDAFATFGAVFRTRALLALAEARLRASDPIGAERWILSARALLPREDGSVPVMRVAALAKTLQGVSLLQRGFAREAQHSVVAAHGSLSRLFGADDPVTCLYSLNVATALEASGRNVEALAVVRHAEPVLRRSMGIEAPTYLRAQALLRRLERRDDTTDRLRTIDFFT